MSKEFTTPLSRALFAFGREANRLDAELCALPVEQTTEDGRAMDAANTELRMYLSLIAKRAEGMASRLNVAGRSKRKKAA